MEKGGLEGAELNKLSKNCGDTTDRSDGSSNPGIYRRRLMKFSPNNSTSKLMGVTDKHLDWSMNPDRDHAGRKRRMPNRFRTHLSVLIRNCYQNANFWSVLKKITFFSFQSYLLKKTSKIKIHIFRCLFRICNKKLKLLFKISPRIPLNIGECNNVSDGYTPRNHKTIHSQTGNFVKYTHIEILGWKD